MANTDVRRAIQKKAVTRRIVNRADSFSVQEGHFVGNDGFVVPNSFNEFYQRFPKYVSVWLEKRLQGCVSSTEAEDWTQELLLHLAVLPLVSKYRRNGKQDVIQTFDPVRMHGANEARFRSFINRCLQNKHNTLYTRWRSRPLSNPRNLSFNADPEIGATDEFCHMNSEHLRRAECKSREKEEQRLRLEEFVRLGEATTPGLQKVMEAFHRTGNWEETTAIFGRAKCVSVRGYLRSRIWEFAEK
jgi:hypothetical protein